MTARSSMRRQALIDPEPSLTVPESRHSFNQLCCLKHVCRLDHSFEHYCESEATIFASYLTPEWWFFTYELDAILRNFLPTRRARFGRPIWAKHSISWLHVPAIPQKVDFPLVERSMATPYPQPQIRNRVSLFLSSYEPQINCKNSSAGMRVIMKTPIHRKIFYSKWQHE